MKKIQLSFVLILTFINTNAQDIIDVAVKEICACSNDRIRAIDNAGDTQKETFLYVCTTNVFNKNISAVLKEYGIDKQYEGTLDRFTKDVNERITASCPNILPLNVIKNNVTSNAPTVEATTDIVAVECVVLNINYSGQYPTIEAKDKSGMLHYFIIFKPFPTDALFKMGGIKIGNNIIVTYENQDIFDDSVNDFRNFKVVTRLEKVK